MAYIIDNNKCVGCGACKYVCLFDIPAPADEGKQKYFIDGEKCYGCGQCENICPNNAIKPAAGHKKIKRVSINPENCIGCSLCKRFCVAKAPFGEIKKPFQIDQSKCFQCGVCFTKCKKDAIIVEYE